MRVLIVASGAGGGHKTAAEAVRDALREHYPACETRFEYIGSSSRVDSRRQRRADNFRFHFSDNRLWFNHVLSKLERRRRHVQQADRQIAELIDEFKPDVICSTGRRSSCEVQHLRRTRPDMLGNVPLISVVTDYNRVNAGWYVNGLDVLAVASESTAAYAIRRGVSPEIVAVTGYPVRAEFEQERPSGEDMDSLRRSLGIPEDAYVIVAMAGGEGTAKLAPMLRNLLQDERLARVDRPIHIVAIAGRNVRGKQSVDAIKREHDAASGETASRITIQTHEHIAEIARYMRASDLVLTKTGGASTAEAVTLGLAVIYYDRIFGKVGVGNSEFVIENGLGHEVVDIGEVPDRVYELLRDPRELERVRPLANERVPRHATKNIADLIMRMGDARLHYWEPGCQSWTALRTGQRLHGQFVEYDVLDDARVIRLASRRSFPPTMYLVRVDDVQRLCGAESLSAIQRQAVDIEICNLGKGSFACVVSPSRQRARRIV